MSIDGWTIRPLGDFLDLITYGFTNPMPTTDVGPYMLTAKDIRGGKIDYGTARHTSREAFTSKLTNKSRPQIGDVLLTKDGSIGRVAVCDRSDVCINQSVALLRPNSAILPRFLSYLLQAPAYQRRMESDSDGSTIKHIYITRVDKMPIAVPGASAQRAIVEVLGALDDKMAANTKLATDASTLVQLEFHRLMKVAQTSVVLGDLLALDYGKSLPATKRVPGDVPVYGSGGIVGTHAEALCSGPGVVVGRKGTAGAVHWSPTSFFPIDTAYWVRPLRDDVSPVFAYLLLKSLRLDEMNSDSAVPGLNRNEALAIPARCPEPTELQSFTEEAMELFDVSAQMDHENRVLATTRDALLPQLMSGKLRVKDAFDRVESLV
ncbi:type I restriction enzyme, S subunit [Arthrobacter subterraneus]|uniref:Type I restriction enzyme, S subunit n=1 Tax=Arthrobacter subterraneus TaxID=335973 RepID=A0A1G8DP44_9MICC|nr:restriction endonuclease subunit S [Arthrobacter subterraneus]SDH59160.1 type I restriction enzyme, S subunit [Arthrobacter subterraneus]